MRTFFYTCIHLPIQQSFTRDRRFATLREFYDYLCRWNTQQPNVWLYAPMGDAS